MGSLLPPQGRSPTKRKEEASPKFDGGIEPALEAATSCTPTTPIRTHGSDIHPCPVEPPSVSDCSTARTSVSDIGPQLPPQPQGLGSWDSIASDDDSGWAGTNIPGTPEVATPEWTPRCPQAQLEAQLPPIAPLPLGPVEAQCPPLVLPMVPAPMASPPIEAQLPAAPPLAPLPIEAQRPAASPMAPPPGQFHAMPPSTGPTPAQQCNRINNGKCAWYRVAYLGGVDLRTHPDVQAPRTGVTLDQNEIFPVSMELPGHDGRLYLCLADGRGWAFDDSALLPHDPSVVRGHWAPVQEAPPPQGPILQSTPLWTPVEQEAPPPRGPFLQSSPHWMHGQQEAPTPEGPLLQSTPQWEVSADPYHQQQVQQMLAELDKGVPAKCVCPPPWNAGEERPQCQ